jgi:Tol biopolymer transport system component
MRALGIVGSGLALLVVATGSIAAYPHSRHASRRVGALGGSAGAWNVLYRAGPRFRSHLFVASADGQVGVDLTAGSRSDHDQAVVSPDGARIAFLQARYDAAERGTLWVMNADGTRARRVTQGPVVDPAWSPTGAAIAFTKLSFAAPIWVVGPDGGPARRVAAAAAYGYSWSPDGTRIAFGLGDRAIHIARVDGGSPVRVPVPGGGAPWRVAWSPDGTRIAFMEMGTIYVMNADGTGVRRLADEGPVRDPQTPVWSPDSTRLAFTRARREWVSDIYVVGVDGTSPQRITRSVAGESASQPAWSPDAQVIAYQRGRYSSNDSYDIFVAPVSGASSPVAVTRPWPLGLDASEPAWLPATAQLQPLPPVDAGAVSVRSRPMSHTRDVVGALAADGPTIAYGTFGGGPLGSDSLVTLDRLTGAQRRYSIDRGRLRDCSGGEIDNFAVAGTRTAVICSDVSNDYDFSELLVTSGTGMQRVAMADHRKRRYVANLVGGDGILAFNTWRLHGGASHPQLEDAALWSIDHGTRRLILRGPQALVPLAISHGVILLERPGHVLVRVTAYGRALPGNARRPDDAITTTLDGSRIVTLTHHAIVVQLSDGRLLHRWPIPTTSLMQPTLANSRDDIAAYTSGNTIHLLRLSDGRDITLALPGSGPPVGADLVNGGLVYSYNEPWSRTPGRIGYATTNALLVALTTRVDATKSSSPLIVRSSPR